MTTANDFIQGTVTTIDKTETGVTIKPKTKRKRMIRRDYMETKECPKFMENVLDLLSKVPEFHPRPMPAKTIGGPVGVLESLAIGVPNQGHKCSDQRICKDGTIVFTCDKGTWDSGHERGPYEYAAIIPAPKGTEYTCGWLRSQYSPTLYRGLMYGSWCNLDTETPSFFNNPLSLLHYYDPNRRLTMYEREDPTIRERHAEALDILSYIREEQFSEEEFMIDEQEGIRLSLLIMNLLRELRLLPTTFDNPLELIANQRRIHNLYAAKSFYSLIDEAREVSIYVVPQWLYTLNLKLVIKGWKPFVPSWLSRYVAQFNGVYVSGCTNQIPKTMAGDFICHTITRMFQTSLGAFYLHIPTRDGENVSRMPIPNDWRITVQQQARQLCQLETPENGVARTDVQMEYAQKIPVIVRTADGECRQWGISRRGPVDNGYLPIEITDVISKEVIV